MTITLHKWVSADKEALMALCNAVDRTFLSDRLLEKNGFRLEETKTGAVVKGGKALDVRLYRPDVLMSKLSKTDKRGHKFADI